MTPGACLPEPEAGPDKAENNPLAPRETPGTWVGGGPAGGLGDRVSERPSNWGATSPAQPAPSPPPPTCAEPLRRLSKWPPPAPREAERIMVKQNQLWSRYEQNPSSASWKAGHREQEPNFSEPQLPPLQDSCHHVIMDCLEALHEFIHLMRAAVLQDGDCYYDHLTQGDTKD